MGAIPGGCRHASILIALVSALMVACGNSSSTGDGTNGGGGNDAPSANAECPDYVRAMCDWQVRCDTTKTITLEACLAQNARTCEFFALPGVTVSSADFGACVARYARDECNYPVISPGGLGYVGPCRFPVGTATNTCSFDLQCVTGSCARPNGPCGRCAYTPMHELGGDCSSRSDCKGGADCVASVCTAQRLLGESCGSDQTCKPAPGEPSLVCAGGVCTAVAARANEPCLEANGALYCGAGLACSPTKICVPWRKVGPGEHCGDFSDQILLCRGGICNSPGDPEKSKCVSYPGIGESCTNTTDDERCEDGMYCDSTVNKCALEQLRTPPQACEY